MSQSASKDHLKAQKEIQKHIDHDHGFYCARFEKNRKKEEVAVSNVKPLMKVTIGKMDKKECVKKIEEAQSARIEKPKTGSVDP
ncbi:hypothetical protein GCK72_022474 [Caenorhabditis remanei]|uniref:Uncharacterized protein n=1 Tax=Caenorhabditis remanei TaxID=31234 RepID=A0A6A5FTZ8_CAERE|nr:hypothetical protein GCK72_022474 [Caenorhabditis remanei]KAF1746023.1 hypothetical protein GCK72_022474 [Caenorhabditis remanei]